MLRIGFIVATLAWAALALYLSQRQIAHVRRHRDRVPTDFVGSVALEDHRKAADYTVEREKLARLEGLAEVALSLAWVLGGIGLLYGLVAALLPPSLWRGVVFLIATVVIATLVDLPFALWRVFGVEEKFGFNRTSVATFVADRVKGWAIGLVVAVPMLYGALWIMRHLSGLWWLWLWFGLVALMLLAPTVYVRLIAPRFNRFSPLADAALRSRIEALLGKSGFRSSGLFTMDASRRSRHGNAYFIGFGQSKRIVLFDTLLSRSAPDEIEAVIAHELGHFRHRHVLFGLAESALVLLLGLAAFGWLCRQPWLTSAFGVPEADEGVQLFVCMLLASVVGPLIAPLRNWMSRRNEFQADDFARRSVGADPMIRALTGLSRDNASTLTPDPLYALAHYSHPPVPLRVRQLRQAESAR